MSLEFLRPFALCLLPLIGFGVWWIDRRYRRGKQSLKKRSALVLREALCAVVILAMSGPSLRIPTGEAAAWLLFDASASASGVAEDMERDVADSLTSAPGDLHTGLIAFGQTARVELPLSGGEFTGIHVDAGKSASNLSSALELAAGLLPDGGSGRIVVLSDGGVDDVSQVAQALRARGIAVDTVRYEAQTGADAQVTGVKLPAGAYEGQSFSVTVTVDATSAMSGTLVLYQNRSPVATREVTLRKGGNVFTFGDVAGETGVVTYEAEILVSGDAQAENDRMGGYLPVTGAPNALIVEGKPGEGSEMNAMLVASGMRTTVILPAQMAHTAEEYRKYDAIVLVNVDYDVADEEAWQALDGAVRGLGRGLTVIGGDSSYALGGYRGSLLEEMLPVTIDVRSKMELPSLALMLVIDKSGSMTDGMFGTTRLELAKEAAMRACEVLSENDYVGVIAFDDAAKWVVPLESAEDVAGIQEQIGTIRPGGGTAFYTALYEAGEALISSSARQKHVIFLTDGEPGDSGYEALIDEMAMHGITVTTVAVGNGANKNLLASLAERGGGRSYAAGEFDNLPKIFTKETYLVSGSYVQNREFTPVITEESPITDYDGFPVMTGYLATTEKPIATVSLVSDRDDPIAAWWQYGSGRVLCFTGDSRGAWTASFLRWEEGASFFAGLVSFVLPDAQRSGVIDVQVDGSDAGITYTAPDGAEDVTGLETVATALLPDGTEARIVLTEIARGVYQGGMDATLKGPYAISVEQSRDGEIVRATEGGTVVGYSREYDVRTRAAGDTLSELSRLTGGLALEPGSLLLANCGGRTYARRDAVPALLWCGLALLLLDIAARRLDWDRALEKRLEAIRSARQTRPASPARKETSAPRPIHAPASPAPKPAATTAELLATREKRRKL